MSKARVVIIAVVVEGRSPTEVARSFGVSRSWIHELVTRYRAEVAMLRAEAGRDPYDRQLSDLIGELSTRSGDFRVRWAAHDVRIHTTGVKLLHHPVVGDLELAFETFPLGADPSQSLLTYTAEPGSTSQDALNLLASWAATTNSCGQGPSTSESELASIEPPD